MNVFHEINIFFLNFAAVTLPVICKRSNLEFFGSVPRVMEKASSIFSRAVLFRMLAEGPTLAGNISSKKALAEEDRGAIREADGGGFRIGIQGIFYICTDDSRNSSGHNN